MSHQTLPKCFAFVLEVRLLYLTALQIFCAVHKTPNKYLHKAIFKRDNAALALKSEAE